MRKSLLLKITAVAIFYMLFKRISANSDDNSHHAMLTFGKVNSVMIPLPNI